jgi:hypothetical protein
MGICTSCGYLTDDSIKPPEVHECNAAHIAVGKKSREMAKQELIKDGIIEVDPHGKIKVK